MIFKIAIILSKKSLVPVNSLNFAFPVKYFLTILLYVAPKLPASGSYKPVSLPIFFPVARANAARVFIKQQSVLGSCHHSFKISPRSPITFLKCVAKTLFTPPRKLLTSGRFKGLLALSFKLFILFSIQGDSVIILVTSSIAALTYRSAVSTTGAIDPL